jgi:hypothetical protein
MPSSAWHGSLWEEKTLNFVFPQRFVHRRRELLIGTTVTDYTGRLFRKGKAVISAELSGILQRLGSTAADWQARLEKLKSGRWGASSLPAESGCARSKHAWA